MTLERNAEPRTPHNMALVVIRFIAIAGISSGIDVYLVPRCVATNSRNFLRKIR